MTPAKSSDTRVIARPRANFATAGLPRVLPPAPLAGPSPRCESLGSVAESRSRTGNQNVDPDDGFHDQHKSAEIFEVDFQAGRVSRGARVQPAVRVGMLGVGTGGLVHPTF